MSLLSAATGAVKWGRILQVQGGRNVFEELVEVATRSKRVVTRWCNTNCEWTDAFENTTEGAARMGVKRTLLGRKIALYSARSAPLTSEGGFALIPEELAGVVQGDLAYLSNLGLVPPNIKLLTVPGDNKTRLLMELASEGEEAIRGQLQRQLDMMQHATNIVVVPAMGTHRAVDFARRLGLTIMPDCPLAVDLGNNKAKALQAMARFGVRVPPGKSLFGCELDEAERVFLEVLERSRDLNGPGAPVFVKLSRGASGKGVAEVHSLEELRRLFAKDPRYRAHLRDPELGIRMDVAARYTKAPNVMLWVGETAEQDRWISDSAQILRGTEHVGNFGPVNNRIKNLLTPEVEKVADWLRSIGFKNGHVGIDLAVDEKSGVVHVFELNIRDNGNSTAGQLILGLADYLRPPVWGCSSLIDVPPGTTLADYTAFLRAKGLHYGSRKRARGVFVTTSAPAEFGAMHIGIAADSVREAKGLLAGAMSYFRSVDH